ncbi:MULTISPECIES: MupG family TIM beta-alpha barrel fold protein [Bacillaceae]|uniref:Cell surface protein n=1 Tax=Gottfriedia luciferensis TaxID=178774 RepID=A0ABX2ZKN0_9BACI|nr:MULTISPECIES: MupG family TIM beta-alpha barrel fold protein [Bacillaceae]ODG89947.1 cell surface protein [Gottfriedia luciferensis]SFD13273.1 hypothetical protein SAMN02799633_02789 [Bacillus sp. UNCCL81]
MLGISIYLSEKNIEKNKKYIEIAKKNGFHSIFTSLHIPEDDPSTYKTLLQLLGKDAMKNGMELMADISAKSLTHLGLDYSNVSELQKWGVTGLRVDYGLDEKQIADLSKEMKIALNASTLTPAFLDELLKYGLQTKNVEAWHNFYPRPETGLATTYLIEKNKWLKNSGISTMAFIPGNDEMRGPLFKGLPTLEKHRGINPLLAYLDLTQNCYIDKVLVGDISIKIDTMEALSKTKDFIELRYRPYTQEEETLSIVEQVHTNREDPARDCIRSMESRLYGSFGEKSLKPVNTIIRNRGSITIDNELYGRYGGELQIMLTNLPSDEKVNVIGIIEDDLSLLQYIGAGKKFKLKRV